MSDSSASAAPELAAASQPALEAPAVHPFHAPQAHAARLQPVPMLDLARQYEPIRSEILDALAQVLDRRQFILGQPVEAFERAAAASLGVAEAVGCSSGTDALWLALAAAGIGPGAAVVTTPFSFFASISSILRVGAKPILSDIDPISFNLEPLAVEKLLNGPQAVPIRAILPVHLFGHCAAWDSFAALAKSAKSASIALIEDAAQAWGARWNGAPAGGLGDIAAFSFYPTKNLNAAGDAGMVATNRPDLAERARMLRQHGMRERYRHDEAGWNARMDGFQGAVLQVNLRHLPARNAMRREAALRYHRLFATAGVAENGTYPVRGVIVPREAPGSLHAWHQYVIRTARRDGLRAHLTGLGIGSEIYYPVPLHRQKALEFLGCAEGSFPEAERAAKEVLALPIFPEIRPDEQERVVAAIADFLS